MVLKMTSRGLAEQLQMDEVYCQIFTKHVVVLPAENKPKQSCNQISVSEALLAEHGGEHVGNAVNLLTTIIIIDSSLT